MTENEPGLKTMPMSIGLSTAYTLHCMQEPQSSKTSSWNTIEHLPWAQQVSVLL